MYISILGEGPGDYGRDETEYCGDIEAFLRALLLHFLQYSPEFQVIRERVRFNTKKGRGRRASERSRVIEAIRFASNRSRAIVIVIDDSGGRRDTRRSVFEGYRDAAYQTGHHLPVVIGTAIEEIEAWILADNQARIKGLSEVGKKPLPSEPESINNPKNLFSQLYGDYAASSKEKGFSREECRREIIQNIDFENLCQLCSKGFKPFYDEVKANLVPIFQNGT